MKIREYVLKVFDLQGTKILESTVRGVKDPIMEEIERQLNRSDIDILDISLNVRVVDINDPTSP